MDFGKDCSIEHLLILVYQIVSDNKIYTHEWLVNVFVYQATSSTAYDKWFMQVRTHVQLYKLFFSTFSDRNNIAIGWSILPKLIYYIANTHSISLDLSTNLFAIEWKHFEL